MAKRETRPMSATHLDLSKEFHPKLNSELNPDALVAGTGRKLWWVCKTISETPCGHEWMASGASRVKGSGCPACAGRAIHIDGRNSMGRTHPHLTEELHLTKNVDWGADNLIAGTSRRLWWVCKTISETPCGHEWMALGASRVKGSGCPACGGQAVHIDGRNSMGRVHPHLTEELHPTKNVDWGADNLIAGTNRRLWWVCKTISESPCGHEWGAVASSRVSGSGCPACAGKAIHIDGRNSMAVTHPDLADEIHPTKNVDWGADNLTAGTSRRLWWVCKTISESPCGHEWSAVASSRAYGSGCPACAGKAIHIDGRNSMAVTHPDLADEIHPTKNGQYAPSILTAGSNKKIWWICNTISETPCGHEWRTVPSSRSGLNPRGCPFCSGREVHIDGRNSMRTTHPDLVGELHPTKNGKWNADNLKAGTNKKLWWICNTISDTPCGHEWCAMGSRRVQTRPRGCPVCSGNAVHIDGRNSMRTTHPDLAGELHPTKNGKWNADNLKAGSNKKFWWICNTISETPCGHEWRTVPSSRSGLNPRGCPFCSGREVHIDGRNSMRKTHPDLAGELHPTKNGKWNADNLMAGAHRYLWWVCTTISKEPCDHQWKTPGHNRVEPLSRGCPACAGHLHSDGRNSLSRANPQVSEELHPTKNSEWNGDNLVVGASRHVWWVCKSISDNPCGFIWRARVAQRTAGTKTGCPVCAKYNFDRSLPGQYYVIRINNSSGDTILYKGGKSNDYQRRFKEHLRAFLDHPRSASWALKLEDVIHQESGEDTHNLEQRLLKEKIRAPDIQGLSKELFISNPLILARENGWIEHDTID